MTSIHSVLRHKRTEYLEGLAIRRSLGWNLFRGRADYRLWHYVAAEFSVFGEYFDKGCKRQTTFDECNDYFDRINDKDDFSRLREEYKAKVGTRIK